MIPRPGPAYNTERLLPMQIVRLRDGRTAIRHEDRLLAVPPMHPDIPRPIRVQVYELVMRRLFGEAYDLANAAEDARTHRAASLAAIASLMSKTPHKNARGHQLAA